MIKTLAAAAVLSLGLAGYAIAQDTRCSAGRSDGAGHPCTTTIIITITIIIITITTIITCITRLRRLPRRRLPRNKQSTSAQISSKRSCKLSGQIIVWRGFLSRSGRSQS